jgi:putative chitinase
VALSAAVDPAAYRQEYLKKLYKLLNVNGEKDPLSYFAKYAAGELPKAALKSFVRQAQLERGVKRGEETGPMWWRVYKEGKNASNGAVIEVVASSKEEALDKAAKEWGVFSDEYRRAMYAEPVRPYKQETKGPELNGRPSNPDGNYVIVNAATQEPAYRYMASDMSDAVLVLRQWITANPGPQWDFKRDPEMRLGQPGQQQPQGVDTRVDYELYSRASGAVIDTFPARNDDEAITRLQDYINFGAGQSNPDNFDVRRAGRAPIPGSTLDLQRQRAAAGADAAQGGVIDVDIDVEPAPPPAPQQPGMGQWNGQWRVLVGGREVYRFGGIGNSQADANRIAAAWLRSSGQGVSGEGFEVYPVMAESLRESVNNYLWHGSKTKHSVLYPQQANDTGGKEESNKNAVYATPSARVAIAMGLTTPGSDTGMFPNDPQMVLFKGQIRKGQMVYLHKVPKDLFINHNGREWYSKPDVKEITPLEVVAVPVDKYLNLIRTATPKDLELQKKYTQKQNVKEYAMPQPSQGPGRYRELNEPLGPETPPEMPAGTIKVDVSDMYDWYKLGQKISDLGSIKPGELGAGPPSTVFAFGSEDLENMYSHELTRLGLKTHDLDEPGEEDIDEGVKSALATAALASTMAMGAQAKAPEMVHQTVEPGDTVYSIARQNNVNPLEIYRLNKMDRNTKLEVGQRVVVPDYSKPVGKMPATVAPTVKPQVARPAPTLKDKISSMIPKFPTDDEGVTLLSDNTEVEAALQTAAKAAGLKGVELAQFMAQTRHESWNFSKMKEVGNKKKFDRYEKNRNLATQLGNMFKGDGERFKGRGPMQLTGRDNYTRASQYIFGDDRLVKNPDLVSNSLEIGAKAALWFWKTQVRPAVKDFNNTTQVVKAINANEPAKVVQARHNKFKEYMAVL